VRATFVCHSPICMNGDEVEDVRSRSACDVLTAQTVAIPQAAPAESEIPDVDGAALPRRERRMDSRRLAPAGRFIEGCIHLPAATGC